MASVDRSLVANLPMFAGLTPAEQDELLREARSVRYPKGTRGVRSGHGSRSFFVLLHGHLRVEKTTPQGQQIVVRYVSAGELFGVAQAMGLKQYPATAVAAVDSVALVWPSSSWPRLIAKFPAWPPARCRPSAAACRIPRPACWRCRTNRSSSAWRMRCCAWPSRPAARSKQGVEIDFPISRQDVAEMTGTTLHTVSRILSAWEQQGLVEGGTAADRAARPHRLFGLAEGRGSRRQNPQARALKRSGDTPPSIRVRGTRHH